MNTLNLIAQQMVVREGFSRLYEAIPSWLVVLVVVIAIWSTASAIYGVIGVAALRRTTTAHIKALRQFGPPTDETRRHGQLIAAVDQWRSAVLKMPQEAQWIARALEKRFVISKDPDGANRFLLSSPDEPIWTEESFSDRKVNQSYMDAFPNLLTALGLIGTFAAIAAGLGGLYQKPDGSIANVENLLGSLGGKFIASIAALGFALLFQLLDVWYVRPQIRKCLTLLSDAVDEAFPRQSTEQQLANLLETSQRQEIAIANISSDVVFSFGQLFSSDLLPKFASSLAGSVQTEMGPVMQEVAAGIRALEEGIKRLESGKQESIGAELRGLTTSLERSLTESLRQMGEQFRSSLSGTADAEFQEASGALKASAEVLRSMNASFENMQAAMQRLLEDAEQRAARTFEEGEGRTKALNELVERLVGQLNESATTSAGEVQRLLVEAVTGMSNKLAAVTVELEERVRDASAESLAANKQLVDEVASSAGRTSAETERLLASIGERSTDFIAAADQLRELRQGVERVLAETGQKVRDLQEAAAAFRVVATEARTISQSLRESQDQHRKASEAAAAMVSRVGEVAQTQVQAADRAKVAFESADKIMAELDGKLEHTLTVIINRMQDYNRQVEKNFDTIIGRVNADMPDLFNKLADGLMQMSNSVEELSDSVNKLKNQ